MGVVLLSDSEEETAKQTVADALELVQSDATQKVANEPSGKIRKKAKKMNRVGSLVLRKGLKNFRTITRSRSRYLKCKICRMIFRSLIVFEVHNDKHHTKSTIPAKTKAETKARKNRPRDGEQKSTASDLLKPLNMGWKRELVSGTGGRVEVYYFTPDGKQLRSMRKIERAKLPKGLTPQNFSFTKTPLATNHPNEHQRKAGAPGVRVSYQDSVVCEPKVTTPVVAPASETSGNSGSKVIGGPNRRAVKQRPSLNQNDLGLKRRVTSSSPQRDPSTKCLSTDDPVLPKNRPRDGEQKSTASDLLKPLNMGWKRELVLGTGGRVEVYYFTPDGKKLRSMREIESAKLPKGLTPQHFSFTKTPLATNHPNEHQRKAGAPGVRVSNQDSVVCEPKVTTPIVAPASKTSGNSGSKVIGESNRRVAKQGPSSGQNNLRRTRRVTSSLQSQLRTKGLPKNRRNTSTSRKTSLKSKRIKRNVKAKTRRVTRMKAKARKTSQKKSPVPDIPSDEESEADVETLKIKSEPEDVESVAANSPTLYCFHCGFQCDNKFSLLSHIVKHAKNRWVLPKSVKCPTEPTEFQCYHCGYSTAEKWHLRSHMFGHIRNKRDYPFRCGICGFRTKKSTSLEGHKISHSNHKPFECHHCGFKTKNFHRLKRHIEVHLGIRRYKCKYKTCSYKVNSRSNLKYHMMSHSKKRPYKCNLCNYSTHRESSLKTHELVHSQLKRFKCDYCDYRSGCRKSMQEHTYIHTNYKPFQCGFCDYKCANARYLKSHVRRHTGEKPFACDQCEYKTGYRSTLRKHIEGHKGLYRWKCTYCPYQTRYQTSYKYHILVHKGKKAHGCPHCEYRGITIGALNDHMRTHTGEKPFHCGKCRKSFTCRPTWKNHLKACDPSNPARFVRARRVPVIVPGVLSSDSDNSDVVEVERTTESAQQAEVPESDVEENRPLLDVSEGDLEENRPLLDVSEGDVEENRPLLDVSEGVVDENRPLLDVSEGDVEENRPLLEASLDSIIDSSSADLQAVEFIIDAVGGIESSRVYELSSIKELFDDSPKCGAPKQTKNKSAPDGKRQPSKNKSAPNGKRQPSKNKSAPNGKRQPSKNKSAPNGKRPPSKNKSAPNGKRPPSKNESAPDGKRQPSTNKSAPNGKRQPSHFRGSPNKGRHPSPNSSDTKLPETKSTPHAKGQTKNTPVSKSCYVFFDDDDEIGEYAV